MKKLRSLICVALMFTVAAFVLVGCGSKADNADDNKVGTKTTISLAEAKTIIVNALAINELKPAAVEQGNRNLLEKLGKFTLLNTGVQEAVSTGKTSPLTNVSGTLKYKNGAYAKYLLGMDVALVDDGEKTDCYFDGVNSYLHYGETTSLLGGASSKSGSSNENTSGSESGFVSGALTSITLTVFNVVKSYLGVLQNCFSDEAFASVYKNEDGVEKVIVENGYTLTLNMDAVAFVKLVYGNDSETVSYFEAMQSALSEDLKNWQNVALVITFDDKDQINAAKVIVNNVQPTDDDYVKVTTNIEVTKYTGEIKEPQWVTDFVASQN